MAGEVIIQGDLVEFLTSKRCRPCLEGDRKCVINQEDTCCMFCSGAKRPCTFERRVLLSGPRASLGWSALVEENIGLSSLDGGLSDRHADAECQEKSGPFTLIAASELRRLRAELARARWKVLLATIEKTCSAQKASNRIAHDLAEDSDGLVAHSAVRNRWQKAIVAVCNNNAIKLQYVKQQRHSAGAEGQGESLTLPRLRVPAHEESNRQESKDVQKSTHDTADLSLPISIKRHSEPLKGYESLLSGLEMRPLKRQRPDQVGFRLSCTDCQLKRKTVRFSPTA